MLNFIPRPGAVLLCDYTGQRPPEMTKVRPVVVVSPRFRRRVEVYVVVPLSTTSPQLPQPYHYRIPAGSYTFLSPDIDIWAKAHLISAVAPARLRPLLHAVRTGDWPMLNDQDLARIRRAAARAIGIGDTVTVVTTPVDP